MTKHTDIPKLNKTVTALPGNRNILYQALLERDVHYDGKLFFGVTSTGIYCRPVCPARKPKPENVMYFANAGLAADAGFRACKRCRPESRPGSPAWQGTGATVSRALRLLSQGEEPKNLEDLSDRLGITSRHLRRLFQQHLGKPPVSVWQENRIALAKTMLTSSGENVADIAFSAGFGSVRRFNDLFKNRVGCSPREWRIQCRKP